MRYFFLENDKKLHSCYKNDRIWTQKLLMLRPFQIVIEYKINKILQIGIT